MNELGGAFADCRKSELNPLQEGRMSRRKLQSSLSPSTNMKCRQQRLNASWRTWSRTSWTPFRNLTDPPGPIRRRRRGSVRFVLLQHGFTKNLEQERSRSLFLIWT